MAVTANRVNQSVGEMATVLNTMFKKKSSGLLEYTELEQRVLERLEHSLLLRAFVDPRVEFKAIKGYVPPRIELDMIHAAVRGTMPSREVGSEGLLWFALDRLGVLGGFSSEG
jgi:hypothetical protein